MNSPFNFYDRTTCTSTRLSNSDQLALVAFALLLTLRRSLSSRLVMLRSANDLTGFSIGATDGDVGQVEAFCFDVKDWTVRYIRVNAGGWLNPRKLLVSNLYVDGTNWGARAIETDLTREEVRRSPKADAEISSEGGRAANGNLSDSTVSQARSTTEIKGFHISANNGEVGHVDDLIIDDQTWSIRYIVVDTRNWWPGKKVVISPRWIDRVDWQRGKIHVDLSQQEIRESPEYDDSSLIEREFEERLHQHYRQPGYWNESK